MLEKLFLIILLSAMLGGCVLTKVATTPMRIGGAVVSVVPIVGNPVDDSIDVVADTIDKVPL